MNQTPEGEATAALVARALRDKSIKITKYDPDAIYKAIEAEKK